MIRRVSRAVLALLLAFCMVFTYGFSAQDAYAAAKKAKKPKVKSVTLNHKVYTVKKGKKLKLKAVIKPKKAKTTIVWKTSKKKYATVSKKGVVKASKKIKSKKAVKVKITATAKGSKKKATCIVYIGTPVKKAVLEKTEITLAPGESEAIKASVTPAKATVKKILYSSSDKNIATVDKKGNVTAVSEGTAVITAKPQDEAGKAAKMTVTVKKADNPSTPDTPSENSAVDNLTDLLDELNNNPNLQLLELVSDELLNIDIPEGKYENVQLVVDAPKGHVENHARFKNIKIKAISKATFVEHSNNTIDYSAAGGKIEVAEEGCPSINIVDGASDVALVNNGTISQLSIRTRSDIDISGKSAVSIPTDVKAEAANSTITTSNPLDMSTEAKVNLNIRSGGEYTNVTTSSTANVPAVNGLGRINVNITDNGSVVDEVVVVANNSGMDVGTVKSSTVEGIVQDASGKGVSGANIYVLPYQGEKTAAQLERETTNAVKTGNTAADGSYVIKNVPAGNYYLLVRKSGMSPAASTLVITSSNSGSITAAALTLIDSSQASKKGWIEGTITDSVTGKASDAGLSVLIRAGGNNISGEVVDTVYTDVDGHYKTKALPFGTYTVQVSDRRTDSDKHYVTTYFDARITSESANTANGSVTFTLKSDEVRFVLSWGKESDSVSSDLDSHLVGPSVSGEGTFHTWFGHRTYGDEESATTAEDEEGDTYTVYSVKYADLDRDDVDWEGPETTTIYKRSSGTYSFYIHDYSNGTNNESTQMSTSQAVVKVYIGANTLPVETFVMPSKPGVLWHVCDFDSDRNKVIAKNTIIKWYGDPEDVGVSEEEMLKRAKATLQTEIDEATKILNALSAGDEKTQGQNLVSEGKKALNGTDIAAMRKSTEDIRTWIDDLYAGFRISDITSPAPGADSEGMNCITDFSSYQKEDSEDESLYIVELFGTSKTNPENLSISFNNSDVKYTLTKLSGDPDGYFMKAVATYAGLSRTFFFSYKVDENYILEISNLKAVATGSDGEEDDQITDWYSHTIYSDDEESILGYELLIKGKTAKMPELTEVGLNYEGSSWKFERITSGKYAGKITVTSGDLSRTYYVSYSADEDYLLGINGIQSIKVTGDGEDEDEENQITDFETRRVWDEEADTVLRYELILTGNTTELPEITNVILDDSKASWKFENDTSGQYAGKITVTNEGLSRTYYIVYSMDEDYLLGIERVSSERTVTEGDETYNEELITIGPRINTVWDDEGEDILYYELGISGKTETIPAKLDITPNCSDAKVAFGTSDKEGYDGTVTVTLGDKSRVYYISYSQDYAYRSKDELFANATSLGVVRSEDVSAIDVPAGGVMYAFTPEVDGVYDIYSSDNTTDTFGELYDINQEFISQDDDEGGDSNFKISQLLSSEQTYYILLRGYDPEINFTASLHIALVSEEPYDQGGETSEGEYLEVSEAYALTNEFRSNPENLWYWDKDDTNKIEVASLGDLERDEELEAVAQLRAEEAWIQYYENGDPTHNRLDGSDAFTAYPQELLAKGENLAWGQQSAAEAITDPDNGWAETNESYQGQGHRRNMLDEDFNVVGIACYVKDGKTCWAMCLGKR